MNPPIRIDPTAAEPPFGQIRTQLAGSIRAGRLAPGTRLPTVRGLAAQLGLAANTVARAYRELEGEGLVETRGRAGTVVAWSVEDAERRLQQAASAYARQAEALGVAPAAARGLVERALGLA